MADNSGNSTLPNLRRQWQDSHSEPALLRLVDACRRRGLLGEAVAVLREGVRRNPRRLAPRVALGRCLFEAGELAASAEILHGIVDQDPTQLVANKLLIDVHLGLGEVDEAAARIDLYSSLNPGDPDLEDLPAQLQEARRAMAKDPAPPVAEPVEEPIEEIAVADTADSIPSPDFRRLWAPSSEETPFPAGPHDSASYWATVSAGPFGSASRPGAGARTDRSEPAVDLPSPAAEPVPPVADPVSLPSTPPLQPPSDDDDKPTATLGRLYMQQGHPREAAKIFRQVLDREPGHLVAQNGMVEVAASIPTRLRAADLLAVVDSGGGADEERRPDRRTSVLRSYLQAVVGRP